MFRLLKLPKLPTIEHDIQHRFMHKIVRFSHMQNRFVALEDIFLETTQNRMSHLDIVNEVTRWNY